MLEIQVSPTNPADVSVAHIDAVASSSIRAPHIREVKAAMETIKRMNISNIAEFNAALDVIERFVTTR